MPSVECKHLFDHEETHCTICGLTVNEIDIYDKLEEIAKELKELNENYRNHSHRGAK